MGFRRIDCFLAAARLKSFSAAARYLYLSQSAVSQQIAALEAEWGFKLFNRVGGSVELTSAGAYLLPRLSTMKATFRDHIDHARDLARDGDEVFCVGFDGPLAGDWIGEAIRIASSHSGFSATPKLYRENISTLTERLMDGTLDAAVTTNLEIAKIDVASFTPLITAGPCVYYPRGHRFASKSSVTIDDLAEEAVLGAYGTGLSPSGAHLHNLGLPAEGLTQYLDGDTAFLATGAGLGVFVASHLCDQFARHFPVESVDLDAPLGSVVLGIACRIDNEPARIFTAAAKKALGV